MVLRVSSSPGASSLPDHAPHRKESFADHFRILVPTSGCGIFPHQGREGNPGEEARTPAVAGRVRGWGGVALPSAALAAGWGPRPAALGGRLSGRRGRRAGGRGTLMAALGTSSWWFIGTRRAPSTVPKLTRRRRQGKKRGGRGGWRPGAGATLLFLLPTARPRRRSRATGSWRPPRSTATTARSSHGPCCRRWPRRVSTRDGGAGWTAPRRAAVLAGAADAGAQGPRARSESGSRRARMRAAAARPPAARAPARARSRTARRAAPAARFLRTLAVHRLAASRRLQPPLLEGRGRGGPADARGAGGWAGCRREAPRPRGGRRVGEQGVPAAAAWGGRGPGRSTREPRAAPCPSPRSRAPLAEIVAPEPQSAKSACASRWDPSWPGNWQGIPEAGLPSPSRCPPRLLSTCGGARSLRAGTLRCLSVAAEVYLAGMKSSGVLVAIIVELQLAQGWL